MRETILAISRTKGGKPVSIDELFLHHSFASRGNPVTYIDGNVGLLAERDRYSKYQETERIGSNESGSVIGIFTGEIHNFKELFNELKSKGCNPGETDVDLITNLYEEYGESFGKKINGLFSFIILDKRKGLLIAGNDRFGGSKPLYYSSNKNQLIISSQMRSIIAMPDEDEINYKSMCLFLKHSFIPSPGSIFNNIKKIEPGCILVSKENSIEQKKYWSIEYENKIDIDEKSALNRYSSILEDSIRLRLDDNDRVGFLLSGGLDSSAVVAMSSKILGRSIPTFTVAFEGHPMDESPFAKDVSDKYKTDHHQIKLDPSLIYELPRLIWELEEPFLESGLLLGHLVYKEALKHVDVVLIGDGSDQVFGTEARSMAIRSVIDKLIFSGAFKRFFLWTTDNKFFTNGKKLEQIKDKFTKAFDFNRWFNSGFTDMELGFLIKNGYQSKINLSEDLIDKNFVSFEDAFSFAAVSYAIRYQLNEVILKKSAYTSGINNLAIRTPYLDNNLVDFVNSLPARHRNRGTLREYILGKSKSKNIHRMATKDILPKSIMRKSKQGGFVPLSIFLEDAGVRKIIYSIIRASKRLYSMFDKDYIEEMLGRYEEIQNKKGYWFYYQQALIEKIFLLLALEIWFRQFIDAKPLVQPSFDLRDYLP